MNEFARDLESIAAKVLELLEGHGHGGTLSAWDLKFKLNIALSPLYMALGMLQERGAIRIIPDGLNYRIQSTAAPKASQPLVGIPIQIDLPGEPVESKGTT